MSFLLFFNFNFLHSTSEVILVTTGTTGGSIIYLPVSNKKKQFTNISCIYAVKLVVNNVANYALLCCKSFGPKIWQCNLTNIMSVVPGQNYSIIKDDADTMLIGPGVCVEVIVVDEPSGKHQLIIGGNFILYYSIVFLYCSFVLSYYCTMIVKSTFLLCSICGGGTWLHT